MEHSLILSAPAIMSIVRGTKSQVRFVESDWKVGDTIYIKEAVSAIELPSGLDCIKYHANQQLIPIKNSPQAGELWSRVRELGLSISPKSGVIPSSNMPRWLARFKFDVIEITEEHIQDITEKDAMAEGLSKFSKDGGRTFKYGIPDRDGEPGSDDVGWPWHLWLEDYKAAFSRMRSLQYECRELWHMNPKVKVIKIRRIQKKKK